MSIAALANDSLRMSATFRQAAPAVNPQDQTAMQEAAAAKAIQDNQASNALDMLVKYIPTESVTLYIAAMSAAPALKSAWHAIDEKSLYWCFAALTPVLVVLIYFGKRKSAKLPPVPPFKEWPWWNIIAATVAFLTWALAVPNSPYLQGGSLGVIAGLLAIVVSTILSVLAGIFAP